VASSAGCVWFAPAAAAVIGAIAGVLVTLSVEWLDLRRRVDDPAGAISVHAVGGLWGLLAVALFGPARWPAQLAAVATLLGFVLPMTYALNRLLNRFYPQRVSPDGEPHGLDLYELGAGAYPEFVTRRDDFRPR
jgi:Amt family ammonium transporter